MKASKKYDRFLNEYQDFVETELGLKRFLLYGAMSDSYWSESLRVLVCNLEPYSIKCSSALRVDYDTMSVKLKWLWNKTIVFSTLQVLALFERSENRRNLGQKLRETYSNYELLESTLKRIAYLNLRITKSNSVNADKQNIVKSVSKTKELIKRQIGLLDPDVIFIGGKIGAQQFSEVYNTRLNYTGMTTVDDRRIVISTRHPSRAKYDELVENANRANLAVRKIRT